MQAVGTDKEMLIGEAFVIGHPAGHIFVQPVWFLADPAGQYAFGVAPPQRPAGERHPAFMERAARCVLAVGLTRRRLARAMHKYQPGQARARARQEAQP